MKTFAQMCYRAGEEAALACMEKNVAVMYFSEGQLSGAGAVLQRELGKDRAIEVIQKNPGALTIDPRSASRRRHAYTIAQPS